MGGSFENQIKGLFFALDEANRNFHGSLRAIYIAFQINPCKMSEWFARQTEKIIEKEDRLRRMQIVQNKISQIQFVGDERSNKKIIDDIINEIKKSLIRVSESNTQEEISRELNKVETLIADWEEKR